jgi:methylated-DNA-[protein]-cysteine S-methyltransferase
MKSGFALFDTAIGRCAIGWTDAGVCLVQLPEARTEATRARVRKRLLDAVETTPPRAIQRVQREIVALLRGEASDLSAIVLDMAGVPPFHRRVYAAARAIAPGATLSYGDLAERIGSPGAARAVGQALGRNPFAIVVPCHRVTAAGGRVGGFSANGGIRTKLRMLALERREDGDQSLRKLGYDRTQAVAHLTGADRELARFIARQGPFELRLGYAPTVFRALAESIVYQQLTGKAAATIFARVRALFPRAHEAPTPEQILRTSDLKLRGAGLSANKTASLRDLARKTQDGTLPTLDEIAGMDDEQVIEALTSVRGIGRWTVEMLLIFRIGRPDVLPLDDYGVRKGFQVVFKRPALPTKDELAVRGERWRPYRSVASWYLWRAAEGVRVKKAVASVVAG